MSGKALSPAELRFVPLLLKAMPQKNMAFILGISVKTVEIHLGNMRKKCCVNSTAELSLFFVRNVN